MPFPKGAAEVRHSIPFLFIFIFRAGKSGKSVVRRNAVGLQQGLPVLGLLVRWTFQSILVCCHRNKCTFYQDGPQREKIRGGALGRAQSTEQIMHERKDYLWGIHIANDDAGGGAIQGEARFSRGRDQG